MARSRKKNPVGAVTSAPSDKIYKTAEHRRERRAVHVAMGEDHDLPHPKQFGNPWQGEKDGKTWFGDRVGKTWYGESSAVLKRK